MYLKNFCLCCVAYEILVPLPGLKSAPPAVEAQSVNHWTAGKVPTLGITVSWWSRGYAYWRMNGFSVTGMSLHNTVLSLLVFTISLGGREARNSVPTWQVRTLNLDGPAWGPTTDTESTRSGPWLWRLPSYWLGAFAFGCRRKRGLCASALARSSQGRGRCRVGGIQGL